MRISPHWHTYCCPFVHNTNFSNVLKLLSYSSLKEPSVETHFEGNTEPRPPIDTNACELPLHSTSPTRNKLRPPALIINAVPEILHCTLPSCKGPEARRHQLRSVSHHKLFWGPEGLGKFGLLLAYFLFSLSSVLILSLCARLVGLAGCLGTVEVYE